MATLAVAGDALKLWDYCRLAYSKYGIKLSFPANTDPTKTYQWRYLQALDKKCTDWGFNDDLIQTFIDIVASYAKSKGILCKGLAVFHQSNVLQICYNELQAREKADIQRGDVITAAHNWFLQQTAGSDPVKLMMRRARPEAYCNLTIWYKASKLPILYLSLCQPCCKAIRLLQGQMDEEMLPSSVELYKVRYTYYNTDINLQHAQNILGDLVVKPSY